jgi:hypothetical protein
MIRMFCLVGVALTVRLSSGSGQPLDGTIVGELVSPLVTHRLVLPMRERTTGIFFARSAFCY